MDLQVLLQDPGGTVYDVTERIRASCNPEISLSVEEDANNQSTGELSLLFENVDDFFTNKIGSGAALDPQAFFNESTGKGCWYLQVKKAGAVRWDGDLDVESIDDDKKARSVSATFLGKLARLDRYNAEDCRRNIPKPLSFTLARHRNKITFSQTVASLLLMVSDLIRVDALRLFGKPVQQDLEVKYLGPDAGHGLNEYQVRVKQMAKKAYTTGWVVDPWWKGLTVAQMAAKFQALCNMASLTVSSANSSLVLDQGDWEKKTAGQALQEVCAVSTCMLIPVPGAGWYLLGREADLPGGPATKTIDSLLRTENIKPLDDRWYDCIRVEGTAGWHDWHKSAGPNRYYIYGNRSNKRRELQIKTDLTGDMTALQNMAVAAYAFWSLRRKRVSVSVDDDGTSYQLRQKVSLGGELWWVDKISEPLRTCAGQRDKIGLQISQCAGVAASAPTSDSTDDYFNDDPPYPPENLEIGKCTDDPAGRPAWWSTFRALYPENEGYPRILPVAVKVEGQKEPVWLRKRLYGLRWTYQAGDPPDGWEITKVKAGDDPSEKPLHEKGRTSLVPQGDGYYYVPMYKTIGAGDRECYVQAWDDITGLSAYSDPVSMSGDDEEDKTLPVPVISNLEAAKKTVSMDVTANDSPVGSRANVGYLQVFKSVGTTAVGDPETSPTTWKKCEDLHVADDITAGRYSWPVTADIIHNAESRYFTARFCWVGDKAVKGAFCTAVSVADSNNVASVTAPTSANFVGMTVDDDNQTNKTEMTFDLQLFFDAPLLANKDRIEAYLKRSTDGGVTYKPLPLAQCELTAGDTSCLLNFRRQVKKDQWVKLAKTVVWNGDSCRVQNWGVVCQITKQPLAISSASVSPTTGQTTSQNFTFAVVATGGTGTYSYQWVFDSAVTYVSGNANSQSPVVRFGSEGAHWGKCTVTDQSSPAQSVVTNQLVCTIVQGGGSLNVTLTPSATSGTSPLSIVLNAYASGGTGVYTWYTFTWDTSQQGSASSSANATLRNVEGLVTGQSKAITCMCKVEDSAGNTGVGICIVTVAPPAVQRWASTATWAAAVEGGNGSGWTDSSGGTGSGYLDAAKDANTTTYVKTSIPAGESSKYLWVYGLNTKPSLPANAVILAMIGEAIVGPYNSGETALTQNMETKWMKFTKNSVEMAALKYGMGDEWEVQTYQGLYYPFNATLQYGSWKPSNDPLQSGVWIYTDFTTEQYIGIMLKIHNAGTATKVARVYGFLAYVLYYLN